MKKLLFLLVSPLTLFCQSYEALFLGNSYTFYNNLPAMVSSIAESLGDTLNVQSNTPGGWRLDNHAAANSSSMQKIRQQKWDFVILQAQSQEPSFPPNQVADETYPFAQALVDSIALVDSCTEPVFYMTWGRKNGDLINGEFYTIISTYTGMQQRLRESYLEMGLNNKATVAPVGISWQKSINDNPDFELYSSDESHPNLAGSYLAACTFYSTLFQKSCEGSSFVPNGLSEADATTLQTIATSTVLDSTSVWNLFAIQAVDTTQLSDNLYSFSTTASNYDNLVWNFGDGTSDTEPNVTHEFLEGQHTVELSVFSNGNCLEKKKTFDLQIGEENNDTTTSDSIVFVISNPKLEHQLYPNPVSDQLNIVLKEPSQLSLYTTTGQLLFEENANSFSTIDLRETPAGYYILKCMGKTSNRSYKIFKNE